MHYAQFAMMLVAGGELNGKRYLGPRTIDLMPSNRTGDLVNGQCGRPAHGMGFGLGEDRRGSRRGMVQTIIMMMQTSTPSLQRDFENAVAQAVIK